MKKKIELKTYKVVEKVTTIVLDTHKVLAESPELALEQITSKRGSDYNNGRAYEDLQKIYEYEVLE